jgi:hypothetical protein
MGGAEKITDLPGLAREDPITPWESGFWRKNNSGSKGVWLPFFV